MRRIAGLDLIIKKRIVPVAASNSDATTILASFNINILYIIEILTPNYQQWQHQLEYTLDKLSPRQYVIEDKFTEFLKEFPIITEVPNFNHLVKHKVVHYISTNELLQFLKSRQLDPLQNKAACIEFEYMVQDLSILWTM